MSKQSLAELLASNPWGRPQQEPTPLARILAKAVDEPIGAFERWGHRGANMRQQGLDLINASMDPNVGQLQGLGMAALGAGMIPASPFLSLLPSSQELRDRGRAAGGGDLNQAIGGAIGDLVNIPDPATSATALATIGKAALTTKGLAAAAAHAGPVALKSMAIGPGKLGEEAAQAALVPDNLFKWRDELWNGVKNGKPFKDEPALWRTMSRAEYDAIMKDGVIHPRDPSEGGIYVTSDADRVSSPGGSYGGKTDGGMVVRLKHGETVPMTSRTVNGLSEQGVKKIAKEDITGVWDAKTGDVISPGVLGKSAAVAPLGKGLASLMAEASPAEQLALKARLEAEAAQTGGQAVSASRDQALENLVNQPQRREVTTASYKETYPDGTTQWAPGTFRANPTTAERFQPEMTIADVKRYIEQYGEPPMPRTKGELVTGKYKDVSSDGTVTPVPGLRRTKRPPSHK